MSAKQSTWSHLGFARTYVLPGLLIFLVPVLSLLFFRHAENSMNAEARSAILQQIQADPSLSEEDRTQAIEFFTENRFSDLMRNEQFAQQFSSAKFEFATFRWMIRLSILSIAASVLVFLLAGICVGASLYSQHSQYLSLSFGWQALRLYATLQMLIQGVLLVALSYWVTALWAHQYYPKLIFVTGMLAVIGFAAVVKAIFQKVDLVLPVEGELLNPETHRPFFTQLNRICDQVGTAPPDHVIVGIDDNFFATEVPVSVNGTRLTGRTLFVSLSLLKHLQTSEAEGILAHEMAHFSGSDTLYSKKTAPLLERYQRYLQTLYHSGIGRLVFYFMVLFRALFQISLSRRSREREFRADNIASQVTSQRDIAAALLRVTAFANFRNQIQKILFEQQRVLQSANISQQLATGFSDFSNSFAVDHDIGELTSSHPFDSHPPLVERMEAVGLPLSTSTATELLSNPPDGGWYALIDNAEELEQRQWHEFETLFRRHHEESLAYRLQPAGEEECAIVLKAFPPVLIPRKKDTLSIDYLSLHDTSWAEPILFSEITSCTAVNGVLQIQSRRAGAKKTTRLKLKSFGAEQQQALDLIGRYWGRHQAAMAYLAEHPNENQQPVAAPVQAASAADSAS